MHAIALNYLYLLLYNDWKKKEAVLIEKLTLNDYNFDFNDLYENKIRIILFTSIHTSYYLFQ